MGLSLSNLPLADEAHLSPPAAPSNFGFSWAFRPFLGLGRDREAEPDLPWHQFLSPHHCHPPAAPDLNLRLILSLTALPCPQSQQQSLFILLGAPERKLKG